MAYEVSDRARALLARMTASEMSGWVGKADALPVGWTNAQYVRRMTDLHPDATVLDFGCGIGRTAVALLDYLSPKGQMIGVDIVPDMIKFCKDEITPAYPNSEFYCTSTPHPLYDAWKQPSIPIEPEPEVFARLAGRVDVAIAFSVFTHLDIEGAERSLRLVGSTLKPGGRFLFTAFLHDESARSRIRQGLTVGPYYAPGQPAPSDDEPIYIADPKLNWVAFNDQALRRMIEAAGFSIECVAYGGWRRTRAALGLDAFQDTIVISRTRSLPEQDRFPPPKARASANGRPPSPGLWERIPPRFRHALRLGVRPSLPQGFDPQRYIALNPDVEGHPGGAEAHYRDFGYFEGRQWR